mgnify:CR=1 FL=1
MRYFWIFLFLMVQWGTIQAEEKGASRGFLRPLVTISFDDGWISQYQEALPLLERYKMPSTFYILTGSVDKPGYMTSKQILALEKAGHEIAAHTVNHPDLNTLPLSQAEVEISDSKQFLEKILGHSVLNFAAPYGSASYQVIQVVKKYFKSNRVTSSGANTKNTLDLFRIKALAVSASMPLDTVVRFLDEAVKNHTWAVLIYHQIDVSASQMSISHEEFESHLKEIQKRNLTVVSIQKALEEVVPQIELKHE